MRESTENSNITIRPLKESDWETMNELCNRRFGSGYLDHDDFLLRVKYPDLNLVAEDNGKAVAMVSMTPLDIHSLAQFEQMDEEKLIEDAAGKETIRFRSAICDEAYEGRGIIRTLLEKVIQNAREQNYGVILSSVWKYNGNAPASDLHRKLGFADLGERHMLWYNQKNYSCIICKGPCRCDAELFELVL